jgi:DNA polymerase III delta subunit
VWNLVKSARPAGLGQWGEDVNLICQWAERWSQQQLREALKAALAADRASKSTTITGDVGTIQELVMRLGTED